MQAIRFIKDLNKEDFKIITKEESNLPYDLWVNGDYYLGVRVNDVLVSMTISDHPGTIYYTFKDISKVKRYIKDHLEELS